MLVASFAEAQLPFPAALVDQIGPCLMRVPPPGSFLRTWMIGPDASPAKVAELRVLLARAGPSPLARRLAGSLREDATLALQACPVPIHYLRPTADRLVPASALAHILAHRPNVAVRTVDGPHLILQAQPARAWSALADWLHAET